MRETIQYRLQEAMEEAEARQESINRHTDQEPGTGMESAQVILKHPDVKVLAGLVAEVLGLAESATMPDGEQAGEATSKWAEKWRKVLYLQVVDLTWER